MEGGKVMILKIEDFIKDGISFFFYLLRLIKYRGFRNKLVKDKQGRVAVLANGPSLKEVIPRLTGDEFKDVDFIVLNFFAFDDVFFQIHPQHYCFADPMFFKANHRIEEVRRLFSVLEKVDWDMTLYIPASLYKTFLLFSGLKNRNITITKVNCIDYNGFGCFRNFLYKKNLSIPHVQTVAILAIYVGLCKGYSKIELYGVDHTFFDSLTVNENNELCNRDSHFYGSANLKPILRSDNNEIWIISDYIENIMYIFRGHDLLASFAAYSKVKIINCTKGSMIDSYERFNDSNL